MAHTPIALLAALAVAFAAPAAAVKKSASPKAPQPKRYASSAGKSQPKPATSAKKTPAKKPSTAKRPATPSAATLKARAVAHDAVYGDVADAASIPVENTAALIPFFEQLYRHQKGELEGPVRILHYGDSHTAADEWTGELRARFKERFGDGGSGYSFAGRPYRGYRHHDVRSGST